MEEAERMQISGWRRRSGGGVNADLRVGVGRRTLRECRLFKGGGAGENVDLRAGVGRRTLRECRFKGCWHCENLTQSTTSNSGICNMSPDSTTYNNDIAMN